MARKITTLAINAFMSGDAFKLDNTSVSLSERGDCWQLFLHGNLIAERYRFALVDGTSLRVSDGGWQSNTTKERLNAIPGVSICQKKGQWFLNGKVWDGFWTAI